MTDDKPTLYVLFTMDCYGRKTKPYPDGPDSWELGSRSMEGYSELLLNAGYPTTLFVSSRCVAEQAPLLEDLSARGVELGPLVNPPDLDPKRYKQHLGLYRETEQAEIVERCLRAFQVELGQRPRSIRSAKFSASDATFRVLHDLGFLQGSLSNPGRVVPHQGASWTGAELDPHYVDSVNRLLAGNLPFLELPITTDSERTDRRGYSSELAVETGRFHDWHRHILDSQLQRMTDNAVSFRTVCVITENKFGYHLAENQYRATIELLLAYFDELRGQYHIVPTTVAGAHARYREQVSV